MSMRTDRRDFLRVAAGAAILPFASQFSSAAASSEPAFKISLAQWSLHRAFGRRGEATMDPLNFAKISKEMFDIDAVEYVNQFYAKEKKNEAYLKDLKKVADDAGVKSVLIMCDGEGALGDPDDKKRAQAVENHRAWVEWAKHLGCHSIRVNAQTANAGTPEEQAKRAADGLRKLVELAEPFDISVIVENHGGLSSDGAWLAGVMKLVDHKNVGTLPDFGNFRIAPGKEYDRYKGVDELMPFAKGVSAKSHDFNEKGDEIHTDYHRMMDIVVKKHKYNGYVGVEYEGGKLSEPDGIKATKKLLERILENYAKG